MGFDSTAGILFNINANADDATSNVAKFRTLLSKDLSDIGAEFDSWSTKIFGEMTTMTAVTTAGLAAIAAGAVALTSALVSATEKYIEYASEIGKASRLTGITAENMSVLRYAAQQTGTDFGQVEKALEKFAVATVQAASGSGTAAQAFKGLGINASDVANGQKDLWSLFGKVSDSLHDNATSVQRTTAMHELFGRQGAQTNRVVASGSAALKKYAEAAEKAGMILNTKLLAETGAYKAQLRDLQAQQQAFDLEMGQAFLPLMQQWNALWLAILQTVKDTFSSDAATANKTNVLDNYEIQMKRLDKIKADSIARAKAEEEQNKKEQLGIVNQAEAVAQLSQEWYGLSGIMESLQAKIAAGDGPLAKLAEEMHHYWFETDKAIEELQKLQSEGKITGETFDREYAKLMQIPAALDKIQQQTRDKIIEGQIVELEKEQDALANAHRQLVDKLDTYAADEWSHRRAAFVKEYDSLVHEMEQKAKLTEADEKLLVQIRAAGLEKIHRDQQEAFLKEIVALQEQTKSVVAEAMTQRQKLEFEYEESLVKYSQIEEQKALKTAQSEAEANTIRELYARNRTLLTEKYNRDLQTLVNSQGWQGVFGAYFAQELKNNEVLMRQWAQSSNQSLLMVKVTMEALRQTGRQAFAEFAQGMGSGIAQAIVYSTSIGQAMRAALASTLESIAARSLMQAIYATGLGFLDLAEGDDAGATAAFTSAAIFGSIGAVAAIAGRAVAPPQGGASTGASASSSSSTSAAGAVAGTSAASPGPTVILYVQGHVIGTSGVQQLTDIINQAVYGNDVKLYASHAASTGAQL